MNRIAPMIADRRRRPIRQRAPQRISSLLVVASAMLLANDASATLVTVTGSGNLIAGSGIFQSEDPFSFATSYDDSAAPQIFENGLVFYPASGPIAFIVAGNEFICRVTYDMTYDANTSILGFGTPGNYFPQALIALQLGRSDRSDVLLANAAEIAGKPGTFSLVVVGRPGTNGTGRGAFASAAVGVPEPHVPALLTAGLAAIVWIGRRRRAPAPDVARWGSA